MPLLKEMGITGNKLSLESSFKEACKDQDFVKLVKILDIKSNDAMKMTSKLETCVEEARNCKNCKGINTCKNSYKGHFIKAEKKEKNIYFTYMPCKYEIKLMNKEEQENVKVRMKDIDTKDKKQLNVIKWMDDFFENYDESKNMKGLYLHGNFGSGKTFLLSALLNELNYVKNTTIEIIYFPEALVSLKEDFDSLFYKMNRYKNVDILLIDDIGAEKVTEWGRDEILGTILQYRMDKHKTTFFTSNYTIKELETNLSLANNNVDLVKARRIIERIKQLTIDVELISESKREQQKW